MVNNWSNFIHRLLPNPDCALCGLPLPSPTAILCPGCLADLPRNRPACQRCAEPLPHAGQPLCGACLQRPPAFDRVFAPYRYLPPFDQLVPELKFRQRLGRARLLSQLMLTCIREPMIHGDLPRPQGLLPVPLHPRRLRARGFNQSLEIARGLAGALDLPLDRHGLIRRRDTRPQSELDKAQRRGNVRAAFEVRHLPPWRHVALVDDVVTTGNTVNELARTLKQAGVQRVDVWAVVRA